MRLEVIHRVRPAPSAAQIELDRDGWMGSAGDHARVGLLADRAGGGPRRRHLHGVHPLVSKA
eukprot:366029-Chlamydomonas_euryale.AAC.43